MQSGIVIPVVNKSHKVKLISVPAVTDESAEHRNGAAGNKH